MEEMGVDSLADVDVQSCNHTDTTLTLIGDYAEAYGLPNFVETPAKFFFHHQLWLYNFGIFTPLKFYDCLYHETTAGRGANEVISCLHNLLLRPGQGLLKKLGLGFFLFIKMIAFC